MSRFLWFTMYNAADTRWSDWQMWSQCSNSCGSGTRKRLRVCEYSSSAIIGHACLGSELEYGPCFVKHCPGKLLLYDRLLYLLGRLIHFSVNVFFYFFIGPLISETVSSPIKCTGIPERTWFTHSSLTNVYRGSKSPIFGLDFRPQSPCVRSNISEIWQKVISQCLHQPIGDFKWHWTTYWPLCCVISPKSEQWTYWADHM